MLVSRLPAAQSGRFDHESIELGETQVFNLILGHETELLGLTKKSNTTNKSTFSDGRRFWTRLGCAGAICRSKTERNSVSIRGLQSKEANMVDVMKILKVPSDVSW